MDCGAFFLVLLDFPADVSIIDLKLPLELVALPLFIEVAVFVEPFFSLEEEIADYHSAKVRDARNP